MDLTEFRRKYPAYKDVPDDKLADGIYRKWYAGKMPRADFDAKIGFAPATAVAPVVEPTPTARARSTMADFPTPMPTPFSAEVSPTRIGVTQLPAAARPPEIGPSNAQAAAYVAPTAIPMASLVTPAEVSQGSTPPRTPPMAASIAEGGEPGALARGFVSQLVSGNPQAMAETLEGFSHLTDDPTYARNFQEMAEGLRGAAQQPAAYAPKTRGLEDFPERPFGYLGERAGEAVASTLPSLVTGGLGGFLGSRVAGRYGAAAGAIGGAAMSAYPLNYGDLYQALKEEGVSPKIAAEWALGGAFPITALDVATPAGIISRLTGSARKEAYRGIAKRIVQESLKNAGIESGTEAAQQAIQEGLVNQATGKPWTWDDVKRITEASISGGLGGGLLGGASGIAPDRRTAQRISTGRPKPMDAVPTGAQPAETIIGATPDIGIGEIPISPAPPGAKEGAGRAPETGAVATAPTPETTPAPAAQPPARPFAQLLREHRKQPEARAIERDLRGLLSQRQRLTANNLGGRFNQQLAEIEHRIGNIERQGRPLLEALRQRETLRKNNVGGRYNEQIGALTRRIADARQALDPGRTLAPSAPSPLPGPAGGPAGPPPVAALPEVSQPSGSAAPAAVREPRVNETPAPQIRRPDLPWFEGAVAEVTESERGYRMPLDPPNARPWEQGDWRNPIIGVPSTAPDWFKKSGWTRDQIARVGEKVLAGEPLGRDQARIADALFNRARQLREQNVRQMLQAREQRPANAARRQVIDAIADMDLVGLMTPAEINQATLWVLDGADPEIAVETVVIHSKIENAPQQAETISDEEFPPSAAVRPVAPGPDERGGGVPAVGERPEERPDAEGPPAPSPERDEAGADRPPQGQEARAPEPAPAAPDEAVEPSLDGKAFRSALAATGEAQYGSKRYRVAKVDRGGKAGETFVVKVTNTEPVLGVTGVTVTLGPGPLESWSMSYAIERAAEDAGLVELTIRTAGGKVSTLKLPPREREPEPPPKSAQPAPESAQSPAAEPAADIGTASKGKRLVTLAKTIVNNLAQAQKLTSETLQRWAGAIMGGTLAEGKYDRKDLYDAVELAINIYIQRTAEHGIDMDTPAQAMAYADWLRDIIDKFPTQTVRSQEQVQFQQFSTPSDYAFAVNWIANIRDGETVLEPSAGTGNIAVHATAFSNHVHANELSPRRAAMLKALGTVVHTEDAEQLDNILPDDVKPTVVVMNPPFSKSGDRFRDKTDVMVGAKHIEAALARLEPGGRLVAIVGGGTESTGRSGEGMSLDAPKFRQWWRDIAAENTIRANVRVAGKVYAKNGTTFATRVLVIDKGGTTSDLSTVVGGQVDDIPALIEKLAEVRNARQSIGDTAAERPAAQPGGPAAAEEGEGGARPGGRPVRPEPRPVGTGEGRPGAAAGPGEAGGPAGPRRADVRPAAAPSDAVAGAQPGGRGEPASPGGIAAPVDRGRAEPGERGAGAARGDQQPPAAAVQPGERGLTVEQAEAQAPAEGELTEAVYESYQPQRLKIAGAKPHPGPLVQSAAMNSVNPPAPTYSPKLPKQLIESGGLSLAQMEAVVYAGQAHEKMLPAAEGETARRRGFFIGDGTGVGKGREVAGIILDNWNQGRRKAVWVSEKKPLLKDAQRDWSGLGQDKNVIFDVGKVKAGAEIKAARGIGFITYDTLKGGMSAQRKLAKMASTDPKRAEMERKAAGTRVEQLVAWLGKDFDGVIAFDESHNMANAMSVKGERGMKEAAMKALAGIELQKKLPNARVVYVSATGATEVSNLVYADRLGLWGRGTAFTSAADFVGKIEQGGIGAMELISRDMKALGLYLARSLSFDGVEYDRLEHPLTPTQREIYDDLAGAWQVVLKNIEAALKLTGGDKNGQAKAAAKSAFWGAHQRFFNQVITSLQMPSVLKAIDASVKAGNSVVVQLVNTNEASTERAVARAEEAGEDFDELDITPKDQLIEFIRTGFPTRQYEEYEDENGKVRSRPVTTKDGKPVENKRAVAARERLIEQVASIKVPDSPLDFLLDKFGVDMVAEVTGRKRRFVMKRDPETGQMKRMQDLRPGSANIAEADAFQAGKKTILVFSQAGGTGRSYHADNTAPSKNRRRDHFLVQAGWRADTAVQGFGRTHRTNQASEPIFRLVTTDLKGQKRFISSIARRLAQLGALTKGQRQTGDQGVFSARDNLESMEAKDALRIFFRRLAAGQIDGIDIDTFEEQTGLELRNDVGSVKGGLSAILPPITQFLNRLLSMKIDAQNLTFQAFDDILTAIIERRTADGTLDQGVQVFRSDKLKKDSERTVYRDPETGAETKYVQLTASHRTHPTTWETIREQKPAGFVESAGAKKVYALFPGKTWTTDEGAIESTYRLVGPMSSQVKEQRKVDDPRNWNKLTAAQAEKRWAEELAKIPDFDQEPLHLITGAVLPIWDRLPGHPTVLRMQTDAGERLLGRKLFEDEIDQALERLGASADRPQLTPEQLAERIMAGGVAELANGWKIKGSRVASETRIEIVGPTSWREGDELKKDGVFSETIDYRTRYFVPTDEAAKVLASIVQYRPVVKVTGGRDRGTRAMAMPAGTKAQRAWHGTRHDFARFELSDRTALTGEGAMAYGYGLYFAGRKGIAEHYRNKLGGGYTYKTIFGQRPFIPRKELRSAGARVAFYDGHSLDEAIDIIKERQKSLGSYRDADYDADLRTLQKIKAKGGLRREGRLYEVEIPENEDFLDWDKPLSEQSEKVIAAFDALKKQFQSIASLRGNPTGAEVYHRLEAIRGDRGASLALKAAGIPGHRFRDAASRDGGRFPWQEGLPKGWAYFHDPIHGWGIKAHGLTETDGHASKEAAHRHLFGGRPTFNYVIYSHDDVAIRSKAQRMPKGWQRAEPAEGRRRVAEDAEISESPQTVAKRERVKKQIAAMIAQMTGNRSTAVAVGDRLWVRDAPSFGGYNPTADLIMVALRGPELPSEEWTGRHEIIHLLREMGVFAPAEWKTLTDAVARLGWMERYDIAGRYRDASPDMQIEEAIADGFGEGWSTLWPNLPPPVRRIFMKIGHLLRRIAALTRRTFGKDATVEDIFSGIESGYYARREAADERAMFANEPAPTEAMAEPPTERTDQGEQYVMPGVAPIGPKPKAKKPKPQQGVEDLPLFDLNARKQGTMAMAEPSHDRLVVSGRAAWAAVIDKRDGAVIEAVRYKKAKDYDFHHSFFLRESTQERLRDGEAVFVWADEDGIQSMEPLTPQEQQWAQRLLGGTKAMAMPAEREGTGRLPPSGPHAIPAPVRQANMQSWLAKGQPIDRALRMPFDWFGGVNAQGQWQPGLALTKGAGRIIGKAKFAEDGRFRHLNPILESARAGLIDRYGLSDEYIGRDRQRALDERRVMLQGAEILKTLKEHSVGAAEARVLQAILTGEAVGAEDMGALAAPIRQAIDDLGAEAVSLGLISPESFERNRGTYLHRVYLKHEEDAHRLGRWVGQFMGRKRKRIIGDQLRGRGIFLEIDMPRVMRDVPGFREGTTGPAIKGQKLIVLDRLPEQGELELDRQRGKPKPVDRVFWPADKPIPERFADYTDRGTWEVRAVNGRNVTLWRDYTKAEREQMGEILDARYTIAKTFMLMAHDLATGRFYKDIAENEEWTVSAPPAEKWVDGSEIGLSRRLWSDASVKWVRVPDAVIPDTGGKKRWGALAGKWVRAEIWRDINEMNILNRPNLWRALLTQWKLNKTARSPVVHMNNVISNFVLMDMADVRFQDFVAGVRAYASGNADFQDAMDHGVFGVDMMSAEIRKTVLEPILRELRQEALGGQAELLNRLGMLGKFAEKLWAGLKAADGKMVDFYRIEDDVFRMAAYMRHKASGLSPEQAAAAAREEFIDYDIRAPWVNVARNSVLPFISYTYRAAPLVARMIATRPWKFGKYMLLAYMANALAYMMAPGDEDEERRSLREEERGYTWLGSPRMMRMPWRDRYGNPVLLDVRRWIPAGDIFDVGQGSAALPVPAPLNFGGPVMLGAELYLNKKAFDGEEITNTADTPLEATGKVADWALKSWLPSAAWVPGSWYYTKLFGDPMANLRGEVAGATGGETDAKGRPLQPEYVIPSAFGVKLKPQDVESGFYYQRRDIEEKIRAKEDRIREVHRNLERKRISPETAERQIKNIQMQIEGLARKHGTLYPKRATTEAASP